MVFYNHLKSSINNKLAIMTVFIINYKYEKTCFVNQELLFGLVKISTAG